MMTKWKEDADRPSQQMTGGILQRDTADRAVSYKHLYRLQGGVIVGLGNVPSNFFQCALKSTVFERNIFMRERLNFIADRA